MPDRAFIIGWFSGGAVMALFVVLGFISGMPDSETWVETGKVLVNLSVEPLDDQVYNNTGWAKVRIEKCRETGEERAMWAPVTSVYEQYLDVDFAKRLIAENGG